MINIITGLGIAYVIQFIVITIIIVADYAANRDWKEKQTLFKSKKEVRRAYFPFSYILYIYEIIVKYIKDLEK